MKVKLLIGAGLIIVAVLVVFLFGGVQTNQPTNIPVPSSTNPNDPAVKGLSIN